MNDLPATPSDDRRRALLRRGVGVLALAFAFWSITLQVRPGSGPAPYLPPVDVDTGTEPEVLASFDHDPVLLLDHRAAPNHRIVRFEPRTGQLTTVKALGDDDLVNGMAMSPAGDRVALAHAPDHQTGGVGLAMLDPETGDLTELVPAVAGRFLLDLAWSPAGDVVYATRIEVDDGAPRWSVVQIDPDDGALQVIAEDALAPAPTEAGVYVLRPDVDGNGRSVERWQDGELVPILLAEDPMTLDHLLATADASTLYLAAHQQEGGRITFGAPAQAHAGPATWWRMDLGRRLAAPMLGADTVLDAMLSPEGVLGWLTRDGLAFAVDGDGVQVIQSRSLRFLTPAGS